MICSFRLEAFNDNGIKLSFMLNIARASCKESSRYTSKSIQLNTSAFQELFARFYLIKQLIIPRILNNSHLQVYSICLPNAESGA